MMKLSKKEKEILSDPLVDNNPIAVQVLGICSALAVTTQLKAAFIMSVSLTAVVTCSNVIISILRRHIPSKIRIIVELTVIATLVIVVEQLLKAFIYDMYLQLSVFVGLIITNCIVMGRAEAFALNNKPFPSLLDGLGNGLGYGVILIIVGFLRELLGSGQIWGYQVIPEGLYDFGYANNILMILPPGAFILIGLMVWLQRQYTKKYEDN